MRFDLIRGTVKEIGSRVTGGRIDRYSQSATLNAVPELWVADDSGKDHHFRGWEFDNARVGHELIVAVRPESEELIQVRNLSTGTTFDGPFLASARSNGVVTFASFSSIALLLFIPAFLVWYFAISTISFSFGMAEPPGLPLQVKVFIPVWIVTCFFLNARWWQRRRDIGQQLRDAVNDAVQQLGA